MPYWSESEAITFLGAVSDTQETFFTEVSDRFTSDVTVHFLRALQDEFGEKLHIVLDNTPYFASNQVKEFIKDSQLKVTYFPTGSPDLNPVEECWRQLKRSLGNRFFQDLDELRADAIEALRSISAPRLYGYFCLSV
jgi:transposase